MTRQGRVQGRHRLFVDAEQQCCRGRRGEDLVEENLQVGIGHVFQAERRLAHLADALAQRLHVLRAKISMMREPGLELVDRLGGNARGENLMEPRKGIVITLEPGHALLDSESGPRSFGHRR